MTTSGADAAEHVVLDTSAYSHLRRGDAALIDVVANAAVVTIPVTVLGELEAGFRVGRRYEENRRALHELLNEPFVRVVDVDREIAERYGAVFAALRRAGTPIPTNDIWIAATTLRVGGHLLTYDRDFAHVEGLPHIVLISAPRPSSAP